MCIKNNSKINSNFVQNTEDKKTIQSQGFSDVRVVGINIKFKGISITKTIDQHGNEEILSNPNLIDFFLIIRKFNKISFIYIK